MDFLNKLYESNYFGIGLFTVISFLVVTFLIVLFFGKKDEKKRKLEETNNLNVTNTSNVEAFKETSMPTPVEMPVNLEPVNVEALAPEREVVTPVVEPVMPINFEAEPIRPVAPISYEEPKVEFENRYVDNLRVEEPVIQPINPIINEQPVMPVEKVIEPISLETVRYDIPEVPKVMEPVRINIPEEPIQPIIREEVSALVTPIQDIVSEPVVQSSYEPVVENDYETYDEVVEEVKVPNIDFDALAKSISEELDELEKNTQRKEEVKVTPINEVTRPTNQFSSVYVNKPVTQANSTIDLPVKKVDEIEPESYTL